MYICDVFELRQFFVGTSDKELIYKDAFCHGSKALLWSMTFFQQNGFVTSTAPVQEQCMQQRAMGIESQTLMCHSVVGGRRCT